MLNLFNLNSANKTKIIKPNQRIKTSKHFPSSEREWKNSIYVYSRYSLNFIPTTTTFSIKMIKSYFTMFNKNIEKKVIVTRLKLKARRFSSNKIYISNGEFKHTNNKVTITLYIHNRQKQNYLLLLQKLNFNPYFNVKKHKRKKTEPIKEFLRLKSLNIKGLIALKKTNKEKHLLIKALNYKNNNTKVYKHLSYYLSNFYTRLVKLSLTKIQLYMYYKQLMYINRSKLNYTYLQYLKKYLENLYNKNVEFNLVNLKRFYLNSDILSESITLKITRERKKILRYLNKLRNKVKIRRKKYFLAEGLFLKKKNNLNIMKDISKNISFKKDIIKELKYKCVTGFRLEAKGRITKRHTASRSAHKIKYKGNLIQIDSSYRGLSSVLLKGNLRSNLQFTKLKSVTRIGSFGIKGWVSGN